MSDLKGKTAIVTGASRGIGKAIASTAASLGINLAIAARQEAPLKEAAQEIANRLVKCGITAILNFSPTRLLVPPKVKVHYVDLALEMESLSFYLNPAYF